MTDKALSERYGGQVKAYGECRAKHGIACAPLTRVSLPAEAIGQMGQVPDMLLAKQYKVGVSSIQRRRSSLGIDRSKVDWTEKTITPEIMEALGTAPDVEIGLRFALSAVTIQRHRIRLSIPSFVSNGIELPASAVDDLGKMPDLEISRFYAVPYAAVRSARANLGIAPYQRCAEQNVG